MITPVQLLSASRQNLWRLTLIRLLVLAAQSVALGFAYLSDLLPLPWLPLAVTLLVSLGICLLTALRLRGSWPVTELEYSSVFELLADSRSQMASVMGAIAAQRDYWTARADLDMALIGKPSLSSPGEPALSSAAATAAGH